MICFHPILCMCRLSNRQFQCNSQANILSYSHRVRIDKNDYQETKHVIIWGSYVIWCYLKSCWGGLQLRKGKFFLYINDGYFNVTALSDELWINDFTLTSCRYVPKHFDFSSPRGQITCQFLNNHRVYNIIWYYKGYNLAITRQYRRFEAKI